MGVQKFNDTFLGNSKVPGGGSTGERSGDSPRGSAVGMAKGVVKADGTAPLGSPVVTKQAKGNTTPSGGKDRRPAGVDSFADRSV